MERIGFTLRANFQYKNQRESAHSPLGPLPFCFNNTATTPINDAFRNLSDGGTDLTLTRIP